MNEACNHIIAFADERDAHPCPVCEVNRLKEAMRHADFFRVRSTSGYGSVSECRGCGVGWFPPVEHKSDCPFRFWLDNQGRIVMPPNSELLEQPLTKG